MSIKMGDRLPEGRFKTATSDGLKDVTTSELFDGKTVVLFAVPGAFTPTCSAKHLPGFVQNAEKLKQKGVDTVACVAVNDAFVMDAWGKAQNVGDKVHMLADGSCAFSKALGLELDLNAAGLGRPPLQKHFRKSPESAKVKSVIWKKKHLLHLHFIQLLVIQIQCQKLQQCTVL